jgi:hypothetical protein
MYSFDVLNLSDYFNLVKEDNKIVYNTDEKKSLKNWIINYDSPEEFPTFSSALNIKSTERSVGAPKGFLGTLVNDSNNVKSKNNVFIVSGGITSRTGKLYFSQLNFKQICSVFCARTSISPNWINGNDEYLIPNESHEYYQQFINDSVVYSLFNNSSQQSSLRQITYKEKLWDIKNEFFWMSKNKMLELSNQNNYSDLYNDARTDSDRHVYKILFGEERIYDKLSPDAKLVLDKATELVTKSMQMREIFANDENHLKSWDAGYAQLKLIWKEYYADEFKEFRQLYKNLEDRMRPLVYEIGFLLK